MASVLAHLDLLRGEWAASEAILERSWRRAWEQESLIGVLSAGLLGAEVAWLTGISELAQSLHRTALERPSH